MDFINLYHTGRKIMIDYKNEVRHLVMCAMGYIQCDLTPCEDGILCQDCVTKRILKLLNGDSPRIELRIREEGD